MTEIFFTGMFNPLVIYVLQKIGDPITKRYQESFTRVKAFEELGSSLQLVRKFLDLCEKKDEKYDHLEKEDLDKVKKCLKEKSEWFDKQMNAQNKLKKYENPVVLTSQVQQTRQVSGTFCYYNIMPCDAKQLF